MNRTINITGRNSNEIYALPYPQNILKFIGFDFTVFSERCDDLCKISMKKGEFNADEAASLRNSIASCHKYYEKNIHGVFEKIVVDCWIDYICRQNELTASDLWDSFIACKNDFETAVFSRLCEYRYNYAINRWTNILKIQEYAARKIGFIYGGRLEKPQSAADRACCFDLLFNVAANEMGYADRTPSSRVYTSGRMPNAPFVLSGVSREILRNVLGGLDYGDNVLNGGAAVSDKAAMDAFDAIKTYIPDEPDGALNSIIKSLAQQPFRVYVPESFKAVVDLEIEALIESGAILQKCGRCREYFLRDSDYDFDYCSRINENEDSRTCLEIMSESGEPVKRPPLVDAALIHSRCDQLYKEMAVRVNVDISQRDFSDWYRYMILIRDKVVSGQASLDDFENFVEYSRTISFTHQKQTADDDAPKKIIRKKEPEYDENGREIKPFVFEKMDNQPAKKPKKTETLGDLLGINTAPAAPAPIPNFQPQIYPGYPVPAPAIPIPAAIPGTPKIIRGVVPSGVSVIGGETAPVKPAPKPAKQEKPEKSELPDKHEPPLLTVPEIPVPEPESPEPHESQSPAADSPIDEFVKVYQSTTPQITPPAPKTKPREPRLTKYEKGGLLKNPYIRDMIKKDGQNAAPPISEQPPAPPAEPPKIRIKKMPEIPKPVIPKPDSNPPELNFPEILAGMERKDGFEGEEVVSHKTRRVMDAIFKQSGSNPFVNKDIKDEDYE